MSKSNFMKIKKLIISNTNLECLFFISVSNQGSQMYLDFCNCVCQHYYRCSGSLFSRFLDEKVQRVDCLNAFEKIYEACQICRYQFLM